MTAVCGNDARGAAGETAVRLRNAAREAGQ
jgi:hypothetical protein